VAAAYPNPPLSLSLSQAATYPLISLSLSSSDPQGTWARSFLQMERPFESAYG